MMDKKAAINLLWPKGSGLGKSSSCSKTVTASKGQHGEEKLTAIATISRLFIAAA